MSALRFLALAISATGFVALAAPHADATPNKTTHLLAMGGCPPYKVIEGNPDATRKMKESCQKDVEAIVAGFKKALNVDDTNIMTRVDEQATAAGVRQAFRDLDKRETREDRVIIYINFHGGNVDVDYNGYDISDEVLALYTEKEPEDFRQATIKGDWMPMKTFRDLTNELEAEEVIIIFEVCEVASGYKNFRYNFSRRHQRDWKGREAIIFTSKGDQAATFNEDGTVALFTEHFSNRLQNTESGNLRDIFEHAALETHRSRRATCMKEENLENLYDNRFVYLDACTQLPEVFDPYGLLDDVHIGGNTVASRWHELKDRKPPVQSKTSEDDPFAWAKDFMGQQSSLAPSENAPAVSHAGPYVQPY